MESSNVREKKKKKKETTKCDKRIVTCDIRNSQYEDRTVKYDVLISFFFLEEKEPLYSCMEKL